MQSSFSFYSAEGLVPATYAYLRLTDTDLDYNGQLLGDIKQNKGFFIRKLLSSNITVGPMFHTNFIFT